FLLRALVDTRWALLGALTLLVNPLFVFHAYSFLTDVPCLSLAVWSLFCYVRAFRRSSPDLCWLLAASSLAAGTYLIRQVGIALPLAALAALLLSPGRRAALRGTTLLALFAPLLPALFVAHEFDVQRGPMRLDPFGGTVYYWLGQGIGLAGL